MIFCTFMETLTDVFIYCFPVKKQGNLICKIEIWLLLHFLWLEIFCNEESSIFCTIQPSGVVFRDLFEPQLRKSFVHQEIGYNSKSIRAVVKNFQCRNRPNLSEDQCQKSCESNQNQESCGQEDITYFKEPFFPVPPLKQCY